jgi:hypothetical protein
MSQSEEQRDARVRYRHPLADSLVVVSARTKHNRRHRAIVAQDGEKILREWWPTTEDSEREAILFLDGYRLGQESEKPRRDPFDGTPLLTHE